MIFGNYCSSVPQSIDIYINKHKINRVDFCKYLGVVTDYKLKWENHVQTIIKKNKYLLYVFSNLSKNNQ